MSEQSFRDKLIDKIAHNVRNPNWGNQTTTDDARIALDTVLEALAGEARGGDGERFGLEYPAALGDWVDSHPSTEPKTP